jgi:hypothetical protein
MSMQRAQVTLQDELFFYEKQSISKELLMFEAF